MSSIRTYAIGGLFSLFLTGCSSTLMMEGEAHPDMKPLSANDSVMIFYRDNGNEDLVTKIRVNDRVVGSLLPERFAQTRACKGTAKIEMIGVTDGVSKGQYTESVTLPGGGNLYFKIVATKDGQMSLQRVDEQRARNDLANIKQISHIINRNVPDCTPAPVTPPPAPPAPPVVTVISVEQPAPVVLQRINLSADALFRFNGSQLSDMLPQARARMDNLIGELRASNLKIEKLRIGGHTDRIGSETYNQKLSQQRAQTVADYLSSHGVTFPTEVIGYGETEPVTTWCIGEKTTPKLIECLQPDRRVTIDLLGQKTITE